LYHFVAAVIGVVFNAGSNVDINETNYYVLRRICDAYVYVVDLYECADDPDCYNIGVYINMLVVSIFLRKILFNDQ
jgi:hypothetical protein